MKDWTDETIVTFFSILPLQVDLGFDWYPRLQTGLLNIIDGYEAIDGSIQEFGEYLHDALQIPLNDAAKATMLEQLKTKSYTAFIANKKMVANAVDTIQGRTGCKEARSLLLCEGEQSFSNMNIYKEENTHLKDEFEDDVLDAILDAIDNTY